MMEERLKASLADRYRIERELGAGGMATVYLAEDLKHHRKVAIKVLKPELAAVLGAERFVKEIATTAQLQHPNILPLFDSGSAAGFLYYVMPYVEGETLREKLNRETQLGVDESVKLVSEVADALHYAHAHGVVHRDIKPENILLHAGRPMVADFGIALAVSAAASGRMTETGLSLGTPHYMSPEQATAAKDITGRSDIYSLASVLYEMLTGNPPYVGSSAQQVISRIVTESPAPVTQLRKSVPPNVAAALTTALEKVPADRFESAHAFAKALGNPNFTTPTAAVTGMVAPASTRTLAWWIRSPWSWGVTAVAAGALVLAWIGGRAARNLTAPTFEQRTFEVQAIYNARFAPDGQTMVFSAAGATGTTPHLYVIRPDNPDPTPLGPDSTHLLSISSKGQLAVLTHAVWLAHRLFVGTLSTLALGDEAPRELADHVREADWAPDGQTMAAIRDTNGVDQLEYPIGTVIATSQGYLSDVRVSPTGNAVAYLDHPSRYDDRGTVVIVDHTGRPIARSRDYASLEGLAWKPGGRAVVFSVAQVGSRTSQSVRELTERGVDRRILSSAGGLTVQDVSSTGRVLGTQDREPVLTLVRGPGASTESNMGVRDYSYGPILSDDGRYLAFSDEGALGGLNYTVMLRKTDGSPEIPIGEGDPLSFSADGRLLLAVVPSVPPKLMLYPTGVGQSRQLDIGAFDVLSTRPLSNALFDHATRFFFCGSRPQQRPRCYVGSIQGDSVTPVTPAGVSGGLISPDGRRVIASVAGRVQILPVAGGPPTPAHGLLPGDRGIRWSPDGRMLWVYRVDASTFTMHVYSVNPESGARTELTTIAPQNRTGLRGVNLLTLADDPLVYGYVRTNYTSLLFTVTGVR